MFESAQILCSKAHKPFLSISVAGTYIKGGHIYASILGNIQVRRGCLPALFGSLLAGNV